MKEDMILAIKKELYLRHQDLQSRTIKSLYLGGGTPSILNVEEIQHIIDEVLKYFDFDKTIEITLEANPDDLDQDFLKALSKTAVNRLSIGTQSFYEEDLKLMNRAHTASQADSSIKRAQDLGFENISIDLIYGSPTSNLTIWKQNLRKAVDLQITHISSYALTIEPKTALQQWVLSQKIKSPNEAEQNEEFYYMVDFLRENGFDHYEISNFGKPGFYSKHNSAYWQYKEYLGLGPSAHSYDGKNKRSWNIANNTKYVKSLHENILPKEVEILSSHERYNEMLMIGLRTIWGVDLIKLESEFSTDIVRQFKKSIQPKLEDGILEIKNKRLVIPEAHWFMADGIASDLFIL